MGVDYIITHSYGAQYFDLRDSHPLLKRSPTPIVEISSTKWIVVEPSSVRGSAADCPIYIIFKPSRLIIFHIYVVVYIALRVSQQFSGFA